MHDRYVLDAGVIAFYCAGDPGVKPYFDRILEARAFGYICEVNVAEFVYNFARKFGWDAAATKARLVREEPFIVEGIDEELTYTAAQIKTENSKYSLANCYLLALALRHSATVLTTDGPLSRNPQVTAILIPIPK